jgi:hypothetical protein
VWVTGTRHMYQVPMLPCCWLRLNKPMFFVRASAAACSSQRGSWFEATPLNTRRPAAPSPAPEVVLLVPLALLAYVHQAQVGLLQRGGAGRGALGQAAAPRHRVDPRHPHPGAGCDAVDQVAIGHQGEGARQLAGRDVLWALL